MSSDTEESGGPALEVAERTIGEEGKGSGDVEDDAAPVATVGDYSWSDFKREFYLDDDGEPPRDSDGEVVDFDPEAYLGFNPVDTESIVEDGIGTANVLAGIADARTVNVDANVDEDAFFSTDEGNTTLVNRYDLEKSVAIEQKPDFVEVMRYWVNKPYCFVIVFHSRKENEKKYYLIDPYLTKIEEDLVEFFSGKLRTTIKYSDDEVVLQGTDEDRGDVLQRETIYLLDRYDLRESAKNGSGMFDQVKRIVGAEAGNGSHDPNDRLNGISARPEPAVLAEDAGRLSEYQVEKLLYIIQRDFVGYERIDGIKHDINVEDISCDGYDSPVFVYHTEYENLITNLAHGHDRLDDFVIKLAQRSGKGISKRQPQVDATLPDGSRAQLTLGREVSGHGTNYTIRQFKDVPFTPIDLINWRTFSLDVMAFLWLCIESNMSLIFAGGTASGKTTSLNAVSLFIPSNTKIVSIEDTREVELPQRNWVSSVTRPSFSADNAGEVDEFDLLEAALRQRPDYIIMGEVRGEEGRTLFQVMSTGHTTYTTFHADNVDEVLKRFTTDPINVSKTLFTALDLVSVQAQTSVKGRKVRRNKAITEINEYDSENDEITVQDFYQWQPETDEYVQFGNSTKLQEIAFDRGWTEEELQDQLFKRRAILAYLIDNKLNRYGDVAATLQAFINDPETVLTLIANERLQDSLADLKEMETVLIDIDPAKEELVPRPDPGEDVLEDVYRILEEAEERIFSEYRGRPSPNLVDALPTIAEAKDIVATPIHVTGEDESRAPGTAKADLSVGHTNPDEPTPDVEDVDADDEERPTSANDSTGSED